MSIHIETPALAMTVQDSGRQGYLRLGLPHSGPMDWWAFQAGNQLVGNSPETACIEIGMTSCTLQFHCEALAAVCGAGYRLYRDHNQIPLWMSFLVHPGDVLVFEKISGGNWVYLALAGGIQSDVWLGSRSVYPRGKLGRLLQAGDHLAVKKLSQTSRLQAGRRFPAALQPPYSQQPIIRVIPGPDEDRFEEESFEQFFSQIYQVSTQSDRMGFRLTGALLKHRQEADIVSRGLALGEIQAPGSGQPIVMMPDHPTTGGYPVVGAVSKVDLPVLAQSEPVTANIRFSKTGVIAAQQALAALTEQINANLFTEEDLWLNL